VGLSPRLTLYLGCLGLRGGGEAYPSLSLKRDGRLEWQYSVTEQSANQYYIWCLLYKYLPQPYNP
jgi:hypothetical protein